RPGSVKRPEPFRLFLTTPPSDSNTSATCFLARPVSLEIWARISDFVGAAFFFAICNLLYVVTNRAVRRQLKGAVADKICNARGKIAQETPRIKQHADFFCLFFQRQRIVACHPRSGRVELALELQGEWRRLASRRDRDVEHQDLRAADGNFADVVDRISFR